MYKICSIQFESRFEAEKLHSLVSVICKHKFKLDNWMAHLVDVLNGMGNMHNLRSYTGFNRLYIIDCTCVEEASELEIAIQLLVLLL